MSTYLVTLVTLECWAAGCGIHFGITETTRRKRAEDGTTLWCPNGHRLCYGPSENQELRDKLAREQHRREQAEAAEQSQRRAVTKLKRRISAGVCPCCNRTFVNMGQHMKSQHPTYAKPQ